VKNKILKSKDEGLSQAWLGNQRDFLSQLRQLWIEQGFSEEDVRCLTGALHDVDVACDILTKTLREEIYQATLHRDPDRLLQGLTRYETWLGEIKEHTGSVLRLLEKFSEQIGGQLEEERTS
jgi:hypothetical protein